jgi:hypothetical protein
VKPAIHRFPGAMAKRVQSLAEMIVERYDGDATAMWRDAKDADGAARRLVRAARVRS